MEKTILLVDDEENVLKSLTRLLRQDGYTILTATSGRDGLKLLDQHPVQVIISDQRMPLMTGSEFLFLVKKKFQDTVRIILSGYSDFDSVVEAINQGSIYKFLNKPWDDQQIREEVRKAFIRYESKQTKNPRDGLTGLYNKTYLEKSILKARTDDNRLYGYLFILDIDHFEKVNEVFGYELGDKLLQAIATRLEKLGKEISGTVARLKDDEFGVFVKGEGLQQDPTQIANDLLAIFHTSFNLEGDELTTSASVGYSLLQGTSSPDKCIQHAYGGVRVAKDKGRSQAQFCE